MAEAHIPKFVLTGGPCSGKSTSLSMLMQKLQDYGVTPFVVPELATLVLTSGIRIQDIKNSEEAFVEFQRQILLTQLWLEKSWEAFAALQPGTKKVLICDRGAMDGAAYIDRSQFERMVHNLDFSIVDLRDRRYDAVFHLVTAAAGAEESYNQNNPARYENAGEARIRDAATLSAWMGHPNLRIIRNFHIRGGEKQRIGFDAKMDLVLKEICRALQIPVPLQISRRFLVDPLCTQNPLPQDTVTVAMAQFYLASLDPRIERRIRVRMITDTAAARKDDALHTYAEKIKIRPGVSQKTERRIHAKEFLRLLAERNPALHEIKKVRASFAWEHQYFQMDAFEAPLPLAILEVELTEKREEILLPPFIKVVREVTDDERYSNMSIAQGLCPAYT